MAKIVPCLYTEIRDMIFDKLDCLSIETMGPQFQNQVFTLFTRERLDRVDEENREHELKYLAGLCTPHLWSNLTQEGCKIFILRNNNIVYGYISVNVNFQTKISNITGIYLDHVLRGSGVAKKMLTHGKQYCTKMGSYMLRVECCEYNQDALAFFNKQGFIYEKTIFKNDGKLKIHRLSRAI